MHGTIQFFYYMKNKKSEKQRQIELAIHRAMLKELQMIEIKCPLIVRL